MARLADASCTTSPQGSLEPAFAGAAFSLAVDELSYVVETKHGFLIIWRKK